MAQPNPFDQFDNNTTGSQNQNIPPRNPFDQFDPVSQETPDSSSSFIEGVSTESSSPYKSDNLKSAIVNRLS